MTQPAKQLINELLKGYYLLAWKRPSTGATCYRLYESNGNPIRNVRARTFDKITKHIDREIKIFKTDKKTGRITLSKSQMRKLHGNNLIKKLYKQTIKNVNTIQPVTEPSSGQIQIQFKRSL